MAISAIQSGAVLLLAANHSEQKSAERNRSIEAARMKSGREHRVPFSPRALEIVETMRTFKTADFIWGWPR